MKIKTRRTDNSKLNALLSHNIQMNLTGLLSNEMINRYPFTTDRISVGGNALTSVRLSVRLFPLYLRKRLTVDLDLLVVSRS